LCRQVRCAKKNQKRSGKDAEHFIGEHGGNFPATRDESP
jgi:hypothetical protein